MTENTRKVTNPMHSRIPTTATGRTTLGVPISATQGERLKTAKTPSRAMAISSPIARAISLPVNHLTMAFETVIPAISVPQPKIMKPRQASFALAGMSVRNELKNSKPKPPWQK